MLASGLPRTLSAARAGACRYMTRNISSRPRSRHLRRQSSTPPRTGLTTSATLELALSTRSPAGASRTRTTGGRPRWAPSGGHRGSGVDPARSSGSQPQVRCTARHCWMPPARCFVRAFSGTISAAAPSARRSREWPADAASLGRESGAGRFHRAQAALGARARAGVFGRTATVLLPKDYLNYRLTGELATEVSDASGTLLFDVAIAAWSEPDAAALDIPPPSCRPL